MTEQEQQAINEAAKKYSGISDDKFANSAKTYDAYNIDESFKNGAEFALKLSEKSGQLDNELLEAINKLIEWDKKYPANSVYNMEQSEQLEHELTAIVNLQKQAIINAKNQSK